MRPGCIFVSRTIACDSGYASAGFGRYRELVAAVKIKRTRQLWSSFFLVCARQQSCRHRRMSLVFHVGEENDTECQISCLIAGGRRLWRRCIDTVINRDRSRIFDRNRSVIRSTLSCVLRRGKARSLYDSCPTQKICIRTVNQKERAC